MLDGNPTLNALLDRARIDPDCDPFIAEFFTFTDPSGVVIARWNDSDRDLTWDGNTYVHGPGIAGSQISRQTGTQVAEFDLTLYMDDTVTLNGRKLAGFIAGGGFFQSVLQHEEAFAEYAGAPIAGTLPNFKGTVTQLRDSGATQATLVAMDPRNLLNVQTPINNFQAPCLHTVFDSGCLLNRDAFKVSGSVQGNPDPLTLFTNLTAPDGYLNLGELIFTGGGNKGVRRAVKIQNAGGIVQLLLAFPNTIGVGDTFVAYPGCDLTTTMCNTKFGNLIHRKGYDYIPVIETAAP